MASGIATSAIVFFLGATNLIGAYVCVSMNHLSSCVCVSMNNCSFFMYVSMNILSSFMCVSMNNCFSLGDQSHRCVFVCVYE